MNLRGDIEDFLIMQKACKVPEATLITLRSYLQEFIVFCEGRSMDNLYDVSHDLLREYQQYLPNKTGRDGLPVKAIVLNLYIWSVKKFLEYLYEDRIIDEPVHHLLKRVKQPTILPKKVLKHEQVMELLKQQDMSTDIGFRDHVLLTFMYYCGLRVGEVSRLTMDSLDLNEETVLIIGKGQKERLLPIPKVVLELLNQYLDEIRPLMAGADKHRELFLNYLGSPLRIKGIQKLFQRYAKKANLENYTSHSLRKGCTTRLIKNGANIYLVQKFLGHSSLNTIQHYAKLDVEDLRKILEY